MMSLCGRLWKAKHTNRRQLHIEFHFSALCRLSFGVLPRQLPLTHRCKAKRWNFLFPPMPSYWLSSNKMTFGVDTNAEGIIVRCAPVVRKFQWGHIDLLRAWMAKQGGYKEREVEGNATFV